MTLPRPSRIFNADDVLSGRVDLSGYPFRYIRLVVRAPTELFHHATPREVAGRIDVIYTCVEFLEAQGWELVHFEFGGQSAHVRRRL